MHGGGPQIQAVPPVHQTGISKEVRQLLTNRSYFYKRFADAYPEVVYKTERVQARIAAAKAEAERIHQEAEVGGEYADPYGQGRIVAVEAEQG